MTTLTSLGNTTLSGGNLVATPTSTASRAVARGTTAVSGTDKKYGRVTITSVGGGGSAGNVGIGFVDASYAYGTGGTAYVGGDTHGVGYYDDGSVYYNNGTVATLASFTTGDVIDYEIDYANKVVRFAKNGGAMSSNISWAGVTGNAYPADDLDAIPSPATLTSDFSTLGGNATGGFTAFDSSAVSVALTGLSATGSKGTLSPTIDTALTGKLGTTGRGTLVPAISAALTGTSATGSRGTLTPALSVALSGSAATGAIGTLTPVTGITIALTGKSGTGSAGTFSPTISLALTGLTTTGARGTLTPDTGTVIALTGVSASASLGLFSASPVSGSPWRLMPWGLTQNDFAS